MTLTRNELIGKRAYNPDASLIGEISDVGFSVGVNEPALIIRINDRVSIELPWEFVGHAKDIVLTKEAINVDNCKQIVSTDSSADSRVQVESPQRSGPQQTQTTQEPLDVRGAQKHCPKCGKKASWIDQYSRWYCYKCKVYI